MPSYGERILDARNRLGMTQTELGAAVGASRSAIAMYEQGKREPNIEMFEKLARVLCVPPMYLMGWIDTPDSPTLNANGVAAVRKITKTTTFRELLHLAGYSESLDEDAYVTIYKGNTAINETPELIDRLMDDVIDYFSYQIEKEGRR